MDAHLVMFTADGQRRDFALTKPVMVVGRKHSCDLRIPISSVSREHCQIERKNDEIYLRDLGSSNGTYHNDARVQETRLKAGDCVRVGPVHFTVVIDGVPGTIEKICTVLPNGGEVEQSNTGSSGMQNLAAASSGAIPVVASSPMLDDDDEDVFETPAKPAALPKPAAPAPVKPVVKAPPPKPAARSVGKAVLPPATVHDDDDDDDPLAALSALAGGDDDDRDVNDVLSSLGGSDDDDDDVTVLDLDDEDDKPKRAKK